MHHEIIPEIQDSLPAGYNSYSVLFIPNRKWLLKIGATRIFELFPHFHEFGRNIGADHLFSWLYAGMIGSFSRSTDLEVVARIYWEVDSEDKVRQYLCSRNESLRNAINGLYGEYDVERASYYCEQYGLGFHLGPFLAFFTHAPKFPLAIKLSRDKYQVIREEISKPTFLLSFGGIDFDDIVRTLEGLGEVVEKHKYDAQTQTLTQIREICEHWCSQTQNRHLQVISDLKMQKNIIFISYAKEDREQAVQIYKLLKEHGFNAWIDVEKLNPGQNWKTEIQKVISNSKIFIPCLSSRSVSKRGFVQTELRMAYEVLAQIPEDQVFVIPIRLDLCQVPNKLAEFHWIDYYTAECQGKLIRALNEYFSI